MDSRYLPFEVTMAIVNAFGLDHWTRRRPTEPLQLLVPQMAAILRLGRIAIQDVRSPARAGVREIRRPPGRKVLPGFIDIRTITETPSETKQCLVSNTGTATAARRGHRANRFRGRSSKIASDLSVGNKAGLGARRQDRGIVLAGSFFFRDRGYMFARKNTFSRKGRYPTRVELRRGSSQSHPNRDFRLPEGDVVQRGVMLNTMAFPSWGL